MALPYEYITVEELKDLLITDFKDEDGNQVVSDEKLQKATFIAGRKMNSYMGWSLTYEELKEKLKPFRVGCGNLIFRLSKPIVDEILFADMYYKDGSSQIIDTSSIFLNDSEFIEIDNSMVLCGLNPHRLEIEYCGGYEDCEMDPNVKLACALITRDILKEMDQNNPLGISSTASTAGARLKKAKNRDYEEEYSYGSQGKTSSEAQTFGDMSETQWAYSMLDKYRRIY